MGAEGQKVLAFFLAVVAVGVMGSVFFKELLGAAGGVENEVVSELKRLERDGFEADLPAGRLRATTVRFQRLAVSVDSSGERAVATGTLDLTGDFAGRTQVSSLGFERVEFALRGGDWVPVAGWAPRLFAVVGALERRRREQEQAGTAGGVALSWVQPRQYRALAWYVRSEREVVQIAEDYRLTGTLPDRPLDEKSTVRLELREAGNGGFAFVQQGE